ncbi:hypothetical protein MTO96_004892 [Rhipicephalus appendiculatus]
MPPGDPPPGYRYRVVEIPLDHVFTESSTNVSTPLSSEIVGIPPAHFEECPLTPVAVTPTEAPSPAFEVPQAEAKLPQSPAPDRSPEAIKEEEEMKEMIREMNEEQEPMHGALMTLLPAFLLLLLFIPVGIFLFVAHETVTVVECPFRTCVEDARRIDDIMEHATVSACVDFYEHTCAYWREENPIPDYAWRHSYMDRIRMNIEADVRDALKAESQRRARTITTGLVATMIDIYRGCISKQDPEKGRKAMSDLDLVLFRGSHLVSQALTQLVLQFDVDGFFRVHFLQSEFAYPREYLEVRAGRVLRMRPDSTREMRVDHSTDIELSTSPASVIRPENLLQKGAVLKEADKRLLHDATLEMYDALRLHAAPERRTRAEKVVDVVKAVTTRILNLKATAVNNPVAFRKVSDFLSGRVVDWHTFFSEVTHHSLPHLRFTVVKLVNSHYLLDINQFIDSLADPP